MSPLSRPAMAFAVRLQVDQIIILYKYLKHSNRVTWRYCMEYYIIPVCHTPKYPEQDLRLHD